MVGRRVVEMRRGTSVRRVGVVGLETCRWRVCTSWWVYCGCVCRGGVPLARLYIGLGLYVLYYPPKYARSKYARRKYARP